MEPSEDVVPVMNDLFPAQKRQRLRPGVFDVDGDVEKALGNPKEGDCGGVSLLGHIEVDCYDSRDQELHQGSTQDPDGLPEDPKDHMPRFMEDEVNPIDEAEASRVQGTDNAVDSDDGDEPCFDDVKVFQFWTLDKVLPAAATASAPTASAAPA